MTPVIDKFQSLLSPDQVVPWSSLNDARFETSNNELSVVLPESIEQLSAVVRTCYDQRWRMLACGQRTKLHWGCQHQLAVDVVISTARLNRLVDHWVDDFTTRVEAGIGIADLQTKLQTQGQFWPVDPLYAQQASVAGIVATADGGGLRQRYGSVRDTVIGVQFVRYDGEVVKAGGRVVKNVAGYDLMKLMTGAYGTLGILSQLNLRLYPIAAQSQTMVLSGSAEAIAEAALQTRHQGITASAMDWVATENGIQLAGRFQGIAAGVNEQIERFQAIATAAGLTHKVADDTSYWSSLAGQLANPNMILCKVGLLPTQLVPLLQRLNPFPTWLARLHNASGLGLIALPVDGGADMATTDALSMLRSHCNSHKGYLTILQAPASMSLEPWGYSGNALPMMKAIKQQFDPHGLFSPGRFIEGL
ncbi:MAG: FAD-binding oxidoreductase [Leptolyngbyaceae cyanobacterium MAG.088]|nr:FAD-binding oxidoreductase [Leptolyngbyaceae cyanobacterium MAG.088]